MIIVCRRIMGGFELLFTDRKGGSIVLGQEIITITTVRILRALQGITAGPGDGTNSIEQAFLADNTSSHFLEVVRGRQVIGREFLRLHSTAITIDFHLI